MVAALAAADGGASALVLEKQELVGGSPPCPAASLWIPNNPVMLADGIPDSYEDAMAHFEAVVGDVGHASSSSDGRPFSRPDPKWSRSYRSGASGSSYCPGYSDYYSSAKGGHDNGHGIETVPFDGQVLGEWLQKLQPGLAKSLGLAVMTNEARSLSHYNRSLRAFAVSARVVLRTYAARLRRKDATHERSLTDRADVADRHRIADPIWTEAPLEDLIVEDGRVVGVRTLRNGAPVLVGARTGCCWPPAALPTTPRCASSTAAISPTRQVVDRQPGRHR